MFVRVSKSSNGFWTVVDTDFSYFTYYKDAKDLTWAVITAYQSKGYDKKNTIKNLKLYYRSMSKYYRSTLLKQDKENFRTYFDNYYPCLKRYVEQLNFIGK